MASTTVVPETPVRGQDGGPSAGSMTELAALEAARNEKRQLLARAAEAARSGKRDLPAGCTADDLPALLQRYYWSEPAAEVLGHEPTDLADLALGHLRLAEVRPPGSATVDAGHLPDGRAVIRLVTDDMPFLVDSVTAEVVRQGFALAHIVHPVVVVRRGLRGQILAFCDSNLAAGRGAAALAGRRQLRLPRRPGPGAGRRPRQRGARRRPRQRARGAAQRHRHERARGADARGRPDARPAADHRHQGRHPLAGVPAGPSRR